MTHFEAYYIGTLVLAFLTTLTLLIILYKKKINFLVRPSIVCILILYFIYLLPSIVFNDRLFEMTEQINRASFLLSIVLFSSLLGSLLTDKIFLLIQNKLPPIRTIDELKSTKFIFIAAFASLAAVTGIYFYNVSFSETGLYAIFCEPRLYVLLREYSLKLLPQKWLIYTYLIAFSCLCPLICAFATQLILGQSGKNKINWSLITVPVFLFTTFFMLITGARVGLLNCVLAVSVVLWAHLKGWKLLTSILIVLIIGFTTPAIISMSWVTRSNETEQTFLCTPTKKNLELMNILKQQEEDSGNEEKTRYAKDIQAGFGAFIDGTIYRSFIIPPAVSGFYMEEAQKNGINLKVLFIKDKVSIANRVATQYGKRLYGPFHKTISSATAPTAFIFFNYMYLGYFSIIFSILGILALDITFFLARSCGKKMGIPLMAMASYYSFLFVQTGYFTVWVTHGYLVFICIILVVFAYSRNYNWKNRPTGKL